MIPGFSWFKLKLLLESDPEPAHIMPGAEGGRCFQSSGKVQRRFCFVLNYTCWGRREHKSTLRYRILSEEWGFQRRCLTHNRGPEDEASCLRRRPQSVTRLLVAYHPSTPESPYLKIKQKLGGDMSSEGASKATT